MDSHPLGEKYNIIRKIGTGGTSEVYLANDKKTGKEIALKIPLTNDYNAFDSIKNEYLFASRHRHPAILRPDTLIFESGKPILVSPFLRGVGLDEYRKLATANTEKKTGPSDISDMLAAILECAEFIHFSGYCYNDFKPSNFILGNRSGPENMLPSGLTLIDFNLVSAFGEKPARRGTLHYIAPEILCGERPRPSSDIYSIGATIYEIITGNAPFDYADENELIRSITESGQIDFSGVPARIRDGLSSMLARDPSRRPETIAEAAEVLKVEGRFLSLKQSNARYYLISGPPPFASNLVTCFNEYRKSESNRAFLIYGYTHHNIAINYLESEYVSEGIETVRIGDSLDGSEIKSILENLKNSIKRNNKEKILFIDDLESIGRENLMTVREILSTGNNTRVAACAGRWFKSELKCELFDPLNTWTIGRATEESLKTYLKQNHSTLDERQIRHSSGGDPELIFYILNSLFGVHGFDWHSLDNSRLMPSLTTEIQHIYDRMIKALTQDERELISLLSVWGSTIPLLIFVKLNEDKREIVESLIKKGGFIREKGTIRFFSGGFKDHIYNLIPENTQKEYHRFWAESAEELITDYYSRLETTAKHWGRSSEIEKGHSVNLEAANEFYLKRDFPKALEFAEKLLELPLLNEESRANALIIGGKIHSAVGNFKTARKMLLDVFVSTKNTRIKAETAKDLAGLYLAEGIYSKSAYYCNTALKYLEPLHRKGKTNECRSLLFKAAWGKKEFDCALELLKRTDEKSQKATTINSRGVKDDYRSEEPGSLKQYSMALDYSKKHNDIGLEIMALIELGKYYLNIGNFESGKKYFVQALEQSERLKEKEIIIETLLSLGQCHLRSGDLFMAIECYNNARQTAESIGNIRLKALAELGMVDVALDMGNYSLANKVLAAIENDTIYGESHNLKLKTDFRRASLAYEIGNYIFAISKYETIIKAADIRGPKNLAMRSEIAVASIKADGYRLNTVPLLKSVHKKASDQNLNDIAALSALKAGAIYYGDENFPSASIWLEDAFMKKGASKKTKLDAAIYLAAIQAKQGGFAESVDSLIETESISAASGFIPLALKSAEALSEVYELFGKNDLGYEAYQRSADYGNKLVSALPNNISKIAFRQKLIFTRTKRATQDIFNINRENLADKIVNV